MVALSRAGITLVAVAVVAALAAASQAEAAPRVPRAEPDRSEFEAGEFCDFPIAVTSLDATRTHANPGLVETTGPFVVTVENLDTGASRTYNASGPELAGGSVGVGPWIIGQPASAELGDPFLIYHRGRVVFAEDGTLAGMRGRTVDICAELS